MAGGTRFLGAVSALGMLACTPLASDLDDYSRDWEPIPAELAPATSAPLQGSEPPPASAGSVASSNGETPLDPTISNPEPSNTSDDTDTGEPVDGDPEPEPEPTTVPEPEPPPVTPPACTDGVMNQTSDVCYFVSTAPMVWNDARLACDAWGGKLVQIHTAEEDAFIAALMPDSMWIGASDTVTDNVFLWIDLEPVGFGNWGPGQPDAFPGADCVVKRQEPGEPWYDQPCNDLHPFVCERSLVP